MLMWLPPTCAFVPFMFPEILCGDALHAIDLNLNVSSVGHGVGHFVDGLLVHLHTVDTQAGARVQLLMAHVALEVLGLLMLD